MQARKSRAPCFSSVLGAVTADADRFARVRHALGARAALSAVPLDEWVCARRTHDWLGRTHQERIMSQGLDMPGEA